MQLHKEKTTRIFLMAAFVSSNEYYYLNKFFSKLSYLTVFCSSFKPYSIDNHLKIYFSDPNFLCFSPESVKIILLIIFQVEVFSRSSNKCSILSFTIVKTYENRFPNHKNRAGLNLLRRSYL